MSRWLRADADQQVAFETFVTEHGAALNALARGLAVGTSDAEDLLQETLAKALERWALVAKADDPYLYCRRIMVNASISSWRRNHREQHFKSAEEVATNTGEHRILWGINSIQEVGSTRTLGRTSLIELLRRLPQRQRAVIVLRYLEDLPDPQIADLLNISAVTVRSTALRALRSLRVLVDA